MAKNEGKNDSTNDGYVELYGGTFIKVKHGLDEKQVASFIEKLVNERDALVQRQEHLTSLAKLAEQTVMEADGMAKKIKTEAEDAAKAIINDAENQLAVLMAEKIKRLKDNLRDTAHGIFEDIFTQAEELKQKTKALEKDFEQSLSGLERFSEQVTPKDEGIDTSSVNKPNTEVMAKIETEDNPTAQNEEIDNNGQWTILEFLPPRDEDEIEAIIDYINSLPEVITTKQVLLVDKTIVKILTDGEIDLDERLMELPIVRQVEKIKEGEQIKIQVMLDIKSPIDIAKERLERSINRSISASY